MKILLIMSEKEIMFECKTIYYKLFGILFF
jgi:hypothetical protein